MTDSTNWAKKLIAVRKDILAAEMKLGKLRIKEAEITYNQNAAIDVEKR